jgi:hypothetical protein
MHHFNPRTTHSSIRRSRVVGPLMVSGEYVISATTDALMPLLLTRGDTALARNSDLDALQRTASCIADVELAWTPVAEVRSA